MRDAFSFRHRSFLAAAFAAGAFAAAFDLSAGAADPAGSEGELLHVRRIAPLFAEKCLACHGQDEGKIKGGYDLRSREAALAGGDSELPGIVPGDPEASPLYLASTRVHEDWDAMPPKEADGLGEEQLAWIRDWIAAGAPWPDAARAKALAEAHAAEWESEDGVVVATSGGLSGDWTERRYPPEGLWGYRPVEKPALAPGEPAHPVDALVARHLPEGVVPAPRAEALTFLRRASFGLTGLPPTPEEAAAYEAAAARDPDAAARELVERLLASPHYGERMAQHWLDVARYADSSGFANDFERGNAWRYRDYVVRAFNEDKPYDRFVREQIAGDEIAPDDPEALVATGFLRMGPWELTGMEVARVARQRFLDDVTNSVGVTFLAHALECARCHDHKFDPVPTRDYYSIQAVFATAQLAERRAPFLPQENTSGFEESAYLELRKREFLSTLERLDEVLLENAQAWFADKGRDPGRWNEAVAAARKNPGAGVERARRRGFVSVFGEARTALAKAGVPEDEFPPKLVGFTPEQFGMERVARKGLERLRWEADRYEPYALAVYNGATREVRSVVSPVRVPSDPMGGGELERTSILVGGDPFAEGEPVRPGVLSALSGAIPELAAEIPDAPAGRRTAFADWVAHPANPLTARAIVNRVWMWHFGEPLAGNPNNFGIGGKPPTHPELLDWLAAHFVESGWSFKELHRAILTSEAYRRSAKLPEGVPAADREEWERAYAVFRPRRLSAEELRDAMLAASGELNPELGGIPNRPEINREAALQPRQVMGTFASAWVPNPLPSQRHRRTLYALKLRGLADPAQEVFNAPAPDFSCERREASTVTPQVFSLFNSEASLARALALATRTLAETESESDEAAVRRAFALALGREPDADELAAGAEHWRAMVPVQEKAQYAATDPPLVVRREAVEENTGEKFAFEERLHAYEGYVSDLRPADCDARTRALADLCLVLLNSNEFVYVY